MTREILKQTLIAGADDATDKPTQIRCRQAAFEFPKLFKVGVLPAEEGSEKFYLVTATTEEDAIQLAFALDGGWGLDQDAQGILELAKSYCRIVV